MCKDPKNREELKREAILENQSNKDIALAEIYPQISRKSSSIARILD